MAANKALEKLDLQLCELVDSSLDQLLDAISAVKCLVSELLVDGNRAISAELKEQLRVQTQSNLVSHLVGLLSTDVELDAVNLNGMRLRDEGLEPLVKAMHRNTSCQRLMLRITGISNHGVAVISEMLKANSSLQELDLYGNKIGDEAATSLAEALLENSSLRTLNLKNTHINRYGGEALLEMLEQNCTLTDLELRSTHVPNQIQFRVQRFMNMNRELQRLQHQWQ